jgi:hypothetical protein
MQFVTVLVRKRDRLGMQEQRELRALLEALRA